jgi:phosphoglycerate dehydrogenase-like enzyme
VSDRPRVLVCCNTSVHDGYLVGEGMQRLNGLADWEWLPSEGEPTRRDLWGGPSADPADAERLRRKIAEGYDALVVCHGAPYIDGSILDAGPRVRLIGEVEGDRFANRIDVPCAIERGVRVVDTTHGSSLPVAEWALAMMLIGLRNAGAHFRTLTAHQEFHRSNEDPGFRLGELTGRRVGLIGLGHIGRRLIELLQPFHCPTVVHDPYAPKELGLAMHVSFAPLEAVLSESEVVVCTAPLTPLTHGMLGAAELALLPADCVFVNVSRGAIVDSEALIERARKGDIRVSLDVFDPEPVPLDSPIRDMPNVFLSPHIAGVTAACRPRFLSFMVDELERFFGGHETMFDITPRTLANRRGLHV